MSFLYHSFGEAWIGALRHIMKTGHVSEARQGVDTKRAFGYGFRLITPWRNILRSELRELSLRYGAGELCWYLSHEPTLDQIKFYAPSYSRFAQDDYGFYGKRMMDNGRSALMAAASHLVDEPHSRRCVVTMWRNGDLFETNRSDLPCTLTWQFLVEKCQLNMICNMRSNDAWLGMVIDVFVNTCVQMIVAKLANLRVGWYQHQVGDLHLYQNHWGLADACIQPEYKVQTLNTPLPHEFGPGAIYNMLQAEEQFRLNAVVPEQTNDPFIDFILGSIQS